MLEPINVKYFKYAVGANIGKETPNDIASQCVICGDSKDHKKKRLHLFTKPSFDNDTVHCFNCEYTGNMFMFLKEYSPHLYEQYKREKRESSFEWLKAQNNKEPQKDFEDSELWLGVNPYKTGKYITEEEVLEEEVLTIVEDSRKMPDGVFEIPKEFIPCNESPEGIKYLNNRKIDPTDFYFCKDWINFRGRKMPLKNSIVIPLWANKQEKIIYGFQARSIDTKFFYTYVPEENTGYKIWNYYGVEPSKRIFVFESVFDALSSGLPKDQIMAALGADLNDERISEFSEIIFCLDNQVQDYTSKVKSQELLTRGFKVFVWPTNIPEKDTNAWLNSYIDRKPIDMAKIILTNIYEGTKGILKIKLQM